MELQQTLEIQFEEPKETTQPESALKLGHPKENAKKNCVFQENFVSLQPHLIQDVQETCYELWGQCFAPVNKYINTIHNMANERLTEDIVRQHFKNDALFGSIRFEEQKSNNKRIAELLKGKSKTGGSGDGRPEFILSFPTNSNYIIVVECKAKVSMHESVNRDNAKDYAVDGVLHYAKALKEDFNVFAIAVSGEIQEELVVSHFYWKKGTDNYTETEDKKLLAIGDYLQVFEDQFFISDFFTRDIAYKAKFLNSEFNAYTIAEYNRCTITSALLMALVNNDFKNNYDAIPTINELGQSILTAVNFVFEAEGDEVRNKTVILREFEKILTEPIFCHKTIKHKEKKNPEDTLEVAKYFINYLGKYILPLVEHSNIGFDVIGRFYVEFIRYAASEQKSGLVLTPAHITELFCDLAEIRLNDTIYDPCCGTGGFLVAAMLRLFKLAGNDMEKRMHIRQHQLCGCELRPDMFAYACSNMRFRGDGKSNIYNGDCFNHEQIIASHKPTVAFLNPPYDVGNAGQMKFIEHALNTIDPKADGRVVAIVQMSCAIKDEKELLAVKKRMMLKHHLKAVLSMPDDLFYPVGVVTCIMIWEANKPNAGRKTWFGYCKDDGFEKRKNLGRINVRGEYEAIKKQWISAYRNQEEIPGLSVRREVTFEDEWCAEAYMETDYANTQKDLFVHKLRDYTTYLVSQSNPYEEHHYSTLPYTTQEEIDLKTETWHWFRYDEVFDIRHGFYNKKPDDNPLGDIPFIGATDSNNGVTSYSDLDTIDNTTKTGDGKNAPLSEKIFENCIAVTNNGSVGYAYYQEKPFTCTHDVNPLYIKKEYGIKMNKYIAMFLCTLIEKERFRWAYGRKWRPKRMPSSLIKLPATLQLDGTYTPDWQFMEDYIKSLPYSKNI